MLKAAVTTKSYSPKRTRHLYVLLLKAIKPAWICFLAGFPSLSTLRIRNAKVKMREKTFAQESYKIVKKGG